MSELKTIYAEDTFDEDYMEYHHSDKRYYREVYLKSEADKVIARNKYKRCLDKAEIASHNWHLHNSFYLMGHKDYELKKCERYERHRLRWLELAEKFKEGL